MAPRTARVIAATTADRNPFFAVFLVLQLIWLGVGLLIVWRRPTGLQGIADRPDAIGGSLEVSSAPGHGTTVAGTVPAGAKQGPRA
jgi:glucose-6-phosphate-specific signal transduction histidine kinase